MCNNLGLGEDMLLAVMKTLEKVSESEKIILLEYLIVGDADFKWYFHTLRYFSKEVRVKLANSIVDGTDNIRKEVINILEKELEGAE